MLTLPRNKAALSSTPQISLENKKQQQRLTSGDPFREQQWLTSGDPFRGSDLVESMASSQYHKEAGQVTDHGVAVHMA